MCGQLFHNFQRPYVIAEAGVNHNGDVKLALKLIEAAKQCGADAIKFQTWITDRVYSRKKSIKPEYQKQGTDPAESEYETVKKLELSFADFLTLKAHADRVQIDFISTPDESESAAFLIEEVKVPWLKVASQDIDNLPFLRYLAKKGLPLVVSTGTATLAEVACAVEALEMAGCRDLTLLHCTSCYPAPLASANLRAIQTLQKAFGLPIGYSDHTIGETAACLATAFGACILEKHFTLSRALPGPDQQASLEPGEMSSYIRAARSAHEALGTGMKAPCAEELPNRRAMRRFLVAARDLPAGHRITAEDLLLKKVASGLPPSFHDVIVGAATRGAIEADERITLDLIAFPVPPPSTS
jgi:N,N'-diacetyllegionaminate synthase